jgi:hypothetical protein
MHEDDLYDEAWEYAQGRVSGPAIGLIITSAISIVLLVLALAFDMWLLASGNVRQPGAGQRFSEESAIIFRDVWSVLILASNIVTLLGGASMKGLQSHGFSKAACILAVIPLIGPCFVLGMPFAIWGLVGLGDREVQAAFRR